MRVKLAAAISKLDILRRNAKNLKEELLVIRADVALRTLLLADSCRQLHAKIEDSKEAQSQLYLKEDKLVTLYDQQTKTTAERTRLCTQNLNKTAKRMDSEFSVTESERPAKRANLGRVAESSLGAPSNVAYSALLVERYKLDYRFKASMLVSQCLPSSAEKVKQLRAKVAGVGKQTIRRKSFLQIEEKRSCLPSQRNVWPRLRRSWRGCRTHRSKALKLLKSWRNGSPTLLLSFLRLSDVLPRLEIREGGN